MKNILVISDVPIYEMKSGNRQGIHAYCEVLKKQSNNIFFALLTNNGTSEKDIDLTKQYIGDKNFFLYKSSFFEQKKHALILRFRRRFCNYNYKIDDYCHSGIKHFIKKLTNENRFDAVIVNYVYFSKLLDYCNVPKKIIYTHDVYLLNKERTGLPSIYSLSPDQESKGLHRADILLAVQENEQVLFHYLAPSVKCYCVYSPFPFIKQDLTNNSNILFFSGNNQFNIQGISWFINKIFPDIIEACPDARLLLGGNICDTFNKSNAPHSVAKNIILCGKYDKPSEFYKLGDISINPVFKGSGLKIKTFEALSYGKTTIVHTHSSEGIFKKHSAPLFITDNEHQFSKYVIDTLLDYKIREEYQNKDEYYISEYNEYISKQYFDVINN